MPSFLLKLSFPFSLLPSLLESLIFFLFCSPTSGLAVLPQKIRIFMVLPPRNDRDTIDMSPGGCWIHWFLNGHNTRNSQSFTPCIPWSEEIGTNLRMYLVMYSVNQWCGILGILYSRVLSPGSFFILWLLWTITCILKVCGRGRMESIIAHLFMHSSNWESLWLFTVCVYRYACGCFSFYLDVTFILNSIFMNSKKILFFLHVYHIKQSV